MLSANKIYGKIPDPHDAKEHCQSFIRKKNRKSVKQSEIITDPPKKQKSKHCWYKISY